MPTLEEFNTYVDALARHDWHYDYSDDSRVYSSGRNARQALTNTAARDPMYMAAYQAWYSYVYRKVPGITLESTLNKLREQLTAPMLKAA